MPPTLHDLWTSLFRPVAWGAGPGAARPLSAPADGNPVQAWLDAAGVPWRDTRDELARRFGVRADNPYRWEVVSLAVAPPPLDGLLWPLGFQAFVRNDPALPPARLSAHVWVGDDAEANIRHAARQLGAFLGARAVEDLYGTRHVAWRWGAAAVTLRVWPRGRRSGPRLANPAHAHEPRLDAACSVEIETGWRPPLAPRERAWLDAFEPLGPVRNGTPTRPPRVFGEGMFAETLLEFMRAPPPDLERFRGCFGLSGGSEALVACDDDALYLVPLARVVRFEVARTLPAKGGGGSRLSAVCETGYAGCPVKSVTVAQGARADDLTDSARRLADRAGRPLDLGEYDYDA